MNPEVIKQQIANLRMTAPPDVLADEEAWLLSLESETDIHALFLSLAKRLTELEALISGDAAIIKSLLDAHKHRKDRRERAIDGIRRLSLALMREAELGQKGRPVRTPLGVWGRQMGNEKLLINEDAVPDEYKREVVKRVPDRDKIDRMLREGGNVNWAVIDGPNERAVFRR